jgi:hypothetical protein
MNTTTLDFPETKNLCGKTRTKDTPYEVWQAGDWTWKVLKKYQSSAKEKANPLARWFCFVTSPYCPNGEMGDVYVHEIKNAGAVKVD